MTVLCSAMTFRHESPCAHGCVGADTRRATKHVDPAWYEQRLALPGCRTIRNADVPEWTVRTSRSLSVFLQAIQSSFRIVPMPRLFVNRELALLPNRSTKN